MLSLLITPNKGSLAQALLGLKPTWDLQKMQRDWTEKHEPLPRREFCEKGSPAGAHHSVDTTLCMPGMAFVATECRVFVSISSKKLA